MTTDNLPAEVRYDDPAMLEAISEALTTRGSRITIDEDPEDIARQLAAQKLQATSVEELNKIGRLVNASDLVEHELTVQSMRWSNSTTERGTGVFAILDAVDRMDGKSKAVAGGSSDILATLVVLCRLNAFPVVVKIVTVGKAKPGQNAPLGLEVLPAELPFA